MIRRSFHYECGPCWRARRCQCFGETKTGGQCQRCGKPIVGVVVAQRQTFNREICPTCGNAAICDKGIPGSVTVEKLNRVPAFAAFAAELVRAFEAASLSLTLVAMARLTAKSQDGAKSFDGDLVLEQEHLCRMLGGFVAPEPSDVAFTCYALGWSVRERMRFERLARKVTR